MNRVRVALVGNSLGVGGVERQLLTLAGRLDPDRFEVELVHLKAEGALREAARQQQVATWTPSARPGTDWRAARALGRRFAERGTEVVMAANQYASIMAWLAVRLSAARPRLVSAFHSSPDLVAPAWKDQLKLQAYGWMLRGFEQLVYVSDRQREAWRRRRFADGVNDSVINNGIDVSRYLAPAVPLQRSAFGWTQEHFVLGLCATLRREKRVLDLVAAAEVLLARGVPVRLLFIGDGPERAVLERACAQRLPAGAAVVTGFQDDVVPYLHACDAVALVSETEAFSIAVLEAMACGKPTILTDVGGAAEQVVDGRHGFLVPVGRPDEIADRVDRLWRSGQGPVLGAAAQRRASDLFSVDTMVRRYESLLAAAAHRASAAVPTSLDARSRP